MVKYRSVRKDGETMRLFARKLPEKSPKKDFIFNMFGSMAQSFVSVVLLIVVSRIGGGELAGVFTLAFSTAQMLYSLALFEVRNIQVTDTKAEFSFGDCFFFRCLTIALMLVLAAVVSLINSFSPYKLWLTVLLCVYMAALAVSEIFQGNLHKRGYLSLAGLSLGCEVTLAGVSFSAVLLITGRLVPSVIAMAAAVCVWFLLFDLPFFKATGEAIRRPRRSAVLRLLRYTAPLVVSVFLNQVALNCPKYAIERHLTDLDQSRYGYLVMPAFCINLLSMFVFRPKIVTLGQLWKDREYRRFNRTVLLLFGWVLAATLLVLAGGYLLGIPVLDLLYNTSLGGFRGEFMLLLLGGGFSAAASLCIMLVAVTRMQNRAIFAYLVTAAVAFILPDTLVGAIGFAGAPLSYLIQNIVLAGGLVLILTISVFSKAKEGNDAL